MLRITLLSAKKFEARMVLRRNGIMCGGVLNKEGNLINIFLYYLLVWDVNIYRISHLI